MLEAGVGWVAAFGFVAHARAVGAACVGCEVVGAGGVPVAIVALVLIGLGLEGGWELPGQAHEYGTGAAVIVVWFLELSDDVLADRVVVSGGAHIGREITMR